MHIRFSLILFLIGLMGCNHVRSPLGDARASTSNWEVTKIADGDTITVSDGTSEKKIRFCGIDAPEESQPLGAESKAYLTQLLSKANKDNLQIDEIERDQYGRSVSEIFIVGDEKSGDKLVNAEMVRAGMAYVYRQYLKNCSSATALQQAEAIAQQQRVGVWSGNYQKPWDYRRQ